MSQGKTLLEAGYAFVEGAVIAEAAVVFEGGRIVEVGDARQVIERHPDAEKVDLGNSIILPGLINPHTHLELSGCCCEPRSASFSDWIVSLPSRIGVARDYAGAAWNGIAQCLRFGVTTIGDISQRMQITRPIIARSPLRAVSYGEVLGLNTLKRRYDELFPSAIDETYAGEKLRIGLSPHAPYTVDLPSYRQCLEAASSENLPLATHLAELPDEEEFLRDQTGALRELYEKLGTWSGSAETYGDSPIRFAHAIGLLDYPTLLAHVNYCTDEEMALLAKGRASVVYCPRTHQYFGHPPHRFREMMERGINVALGTDSCASSPDLNLVEEIRLVHRLYPEIEAKDLFAMITTSAAKAVQWDREIGSIVAGKGADFTIFSVRSDDPLREILESDVLPAQVWIDGAMINGTGG